MNSKSGYTYDRCCETACCLVGTSALRECWCQPCDICFSQPLYLKPAITPPLLCMFLYHHVARFNLWTQIYAAQVRDVTLWVLGFYVLNPTVGQATVHIQARLLCRCFSRVDHHTLSEADWVCFPQDTACPGQGSAVGLFAGEAKEPAWPHQSIPHAWLLLWEAFVWHSACYC